MAKYIINNGELLKNENVFSAEHPVMMGANTLRLKWFVISSALPFYQNEFDKIERYAKYKGLNLPPWMTANTFAQDVRHLFQMNRIYQGGILNMMIFSEDVEQNAKYIMTAHAEERQEFLLNTNGYRFDIFRRNRLFFDSAEIYDVGVSATETSAFYEMKSQKLDQIIILNEWKHIARFIGANFMMVRDDVVYTPAVKEGAIDDVMREKTIQACLNLDFKVYDDCIISPDDLKSADEVLVIDPIIGIRWSLGFGERRYYFKVAPVLHDKVNQLYFGKVNG